MGRVIRAHRKAARKGPAVGTSLPVRSIPVGSVVCNVEHRIGGRGVFATASGDHAVVISHSRDNDTTRIKLSSGGEKTVEGGCRATVGGGRRTKKPMLKVRNSNKGKKRKSRRKAMNPVEHSHGDGNNQQIVGHVSTVLRRDAPRGRNLSLIADRRRRNSVEHTRGVGNNNHYIGHVSTVRRDAPPGRTLGLIVPSRSVIIRLRGQAVNPVDHPPGIRPALIVPRITPTLRGQAAAIAAAA